MKLSHVLSLVFALAITPVGAASNSNQDQQNELKAKLAETLNIQVHQLQDSPVPGLYEALTNRGVVYVTHDGSKLFHGNLYDLDAGMKNLTEAAMAGPRLKMMKPLEKNMLVYKAKNEKHVVTVFTDISCGYCRKLHQQMDEYNELGITVRYLAYPRAGIPSANADEMEAVWCAKEPLKAMTSAKAGQNVKAAKCDAKIQEQYNLGTSFGINGTPAIVLENGSLIPGYQPPQQLLGVLQSI
ncbi:bifunctional protein-disulfide isomerase/oxidoreductase DsbC [Shewanella gelidii]|uniref:Thiol:disulfide interchange protein n=1 Tax=Shewanella gelidii TaxID=1642821 RepID=A0A917NE71_9GAMM|nr:bifunctional protein-disulfide isomerase/oxidoreductase DsbC [Shewanella gelidii]MCL1099331.1 bifunctional protein-disulfide isomerase/oxidoreductase DsbC [Shewanella gelidii]GGI92041.1 thiol:disulfide interchange protein DsbC [Shewanella gelidii]